MEAEAQRTVTLDEVLDKVPAKRRHTLKRLLKPRFNQIMQGLDAHTWNTLHAAMVELGLDYKRVYLVRSALRIAGLCSFDQPFGKVRADTTPTQQKRLFTRTRDGGYQYRT